MGTYSTRDLTNYTRLSVTTKTTITHNRLSPAYQSMLTFRSAEEEEWKEGSSGV